MITRENIGSGKSDQCGRADDAAAGPNTLF